MNAQLATGIDNRGPVVVCVNVVTALYVQFHSTIVPGAVDVLPSNVQSSVLPPFVRLHVSVSVPATPKLAVATVGGGTGSTVRVADFETPA